MHIQKLKLYTAQLNKQAEFYSEILGFEIFDITTHEVSFKCGSTILTFEQRQDVKPYHFAFNIPAHKEDEALTWLKARVGILKDGDHEIQNFDFWNARAIYFYDADKNIVEFISRRGLKQYSQEKFDIKSIMEVSEIGLVSKSIKENYHILNKTLGVDIYSGSFERFCAIGDEYGLFICVSKDKGWFPVNDFAHISDFEVEVKVRQDEICSLAFENGKIQPLPC